MSCFSLTIITCQLTSSHTSLDFLNFIFSYKEGNISVYAFCKTLPSEVHFYEECVSFHTATNVLNGNGLLSVDCVRLSCSYVLEEENVLLQKSLEGSGELYATYYS